MTITYSVLVGDKNTDGSIKQWVNNSLIPSAIILDLAEQYIYQSLRIREMVTLATGTIAADAETINLPERYRTPLSLWISGAEKGQIKHRLKEDVEAARPYDGDGNLVAERPKLFFADATAIRFQSKSDKEYPYRFWHYAALAPLSDSNQTNALTEKYADVLYAACEFRANWWLRKADQVGSQQMTDAIIRRANREAGEEMGRDTEIDIYVA